MNANLVMHAGGRKVDFEEMAAVPTPAATRTWRPVSHGQLVRTVLDTLAERGYSVARQQFGLSKDNSRLFCTLDLTSVLGNGITLAVGVRNSINKTFPMGFTAGSRVFVCDNLAFSGELIVRRKHTSNGQANFSQDVFAGVERLKDFQGQEAMKIAWMQATELSDAQAESYILRAAADKGIVPLRLIPEVLKCWREPPHPEFQPRTVWSLYNAFTEALKGTQNRNPNEGAQRTMRLGAMLALPAASQPAAEPLVALAA